MALLSFSTKGSASAPSGGEGHVRRSTEFCIEQARSPFAVDGELQADAALVAEVARRGRRRTARWPAGPTCSCFPILDAGNIGYKLTERLAGARAIGPLLQGLAGPGARSLPRVVRHRRRPRK